VALEGIIFEEEIKRVILKRKRFDSEALYKVFSQTDKDKFNYYQWRVFSYFCGDSSFSWSHHPFQYYSGGSVIIPPRNPDDWQRLNPARVIKEKMIKETKLIQSSLARIVDDEDA
jgi:hypothetical protein